jgi:hypothetical protein
MRRPVKPAHPGSASTISSFGVDADGELYIVGYSTGQIYKVVGPLSAPPTPVGLRIIRD